MTIPLKFICMFRRRKQCIYVINITSIYYRDEIYRAISKPSTFKTTRKNVWNCMTNISSMFLVQCWRLRTSSRPFYDFIKTTI